MNIVKPSVMLTCVVLLTSIAIGKEVDKPADPTGILRKPIPDKLVVLTRLGECQRADP